MKQIASHIRQCMMSKKYESGRLCYLRQNESLLCIVYFDGSNKKNQIYKRIGLKEQ